MEKDLVELEKLQING
jgi:hypothetical protein